MDGQNAGIIRRRRIRRVYDGSVTGVFCVCGGSFLYHGAHTDYFWGFLGIFRDLDGIWVGNYLGAAGRGSRHGYDIHLFWNIYVIFYIIIPYEL